MEIYEMTAAETAAAIRGRKVSAFEVTRAGLERLHKYESAVNACITVLDERA